jgi:hypothetical protein
MMDERNYGSQSERTAVLFERVAVLESLYKREMAAGVEIREGVFSDIEEIRRDISELRRECESLDRRVTPYVQAHEMQTKDQKEFGKMMVAAIVTMVFGIVGVAIVSPLIQHLLFGAHP